MHETTEGPGAFAAGTAKLVGTDLRRITDHVKTLMDDKDFYQKMSKAINPYGDGQAAERIVKILNDSKQAMAA